MVPSEPMYLIANTAISHKWGMPEPCDQMAIAEGEGSCRYVRQRERENIYIE